MSVWWSLGEDATSNRSGTSSRRSRGRRPLSSFFNGTSTVGGRNSGSAQAHTKRIDPNPPRLELPRLDMSHLSPGPSPSQRSPTSTRSVIDPTLSPEMSARPLSSVTQRSPVSPLEYEHEAPSRLTLAHVLDYGGNIPINHVPPETQRQLPRFHSISSNRRWPSQRNQQGARTSGPRSTQSRNQTQPERRARWIPKHSRGKVWFPAMESSAVRTKFFHAIVSGSILALVLVTCTSPFPLYPLFTHSPRKSSKFRKSPRKEKQTHR